MRYTLRAGEAFSVEAEAQAPTTVANGGPAIVYYGTGSVSASSYDGTIAAGASATFDESQWLASAERSELSIEFDSEDVADIPSYVVPTLARKPASTDRVLYVSKQGSDSTGDGLSWGSAFKTLGAALSALGTSAGLVKVGVGEYVESVTLDAEGQRLEGTSRRFAAGTVIKATGTSADIITVTAYQCEVSNVHLLGSSSSWNGKALSLDGAFYGRFSDIIIRNGDNSATSSTGGIGVNITRCEGSHFENIQVGECRIGFHFDSEATENTLTQLSTSNCYQDLVFDAADQSGGGNVFNRFKAGSCKSTTPNVVDIGAGGSNVFVVFDCNESPRDPNKLLVSSDNNVFIGGVVAPQSVLTVSGDYNTFHDLRVLGDVVVTGTGNVFRNPRINQATFDDSGATNTIVDNLRTEGSCTVTYDATTRFPTYTNTPP